MLLLPGILKPPAMLTVEANFAGGNLAATGLKALLRLSQNALSQNGLSQNGYGYIHIHISATALLAPGVTNSIVSLLPSTRDLGSRLSDPGPTRTQFISLGHPHPISGFRFEVAVPIF